MTGKNYKTLTWETGIWKDFLQSTYDFVWENLLPENDPKSFYVIVSKSDTLIPEEISKYKRVVLIYDDIAKIRKLPEFVPRPTYLWYGLEEPPDSWKTRNWLGTLHFWDAVKFEIPERTQGTQPYEIFLCGNAKKSRANRLKQLLTGVSVSCVGFDWGEYFPVEKHLPRSEGLLDSVKQGSSECAAELVYHNKSIKAFLSLRLPNILRRGNVPVVDLYHDPNKKLLITDKLKQNCYAKDPEEIKKACLFAKTISREELQEEYDEQVRRALFDMAQLRIALQRGGLTL